MRRIDLSVWALLVGAAAFLTGCDLGKGKGTIQGKLANFQSAANAHLLRNGRWNRPRNVKAPIDEITIDLLKAPSEGDPGFEDPDSWPVLMTVSPNPDGTFTFGEVEEGTYSVRLNQPEFAATAYFIDSTDFTLGDGETINVVLPLVTQIMLPRTINMGGNDELFDVGHHGDQETGIIYFVADGFFGVLDTDRGILDLIKSRVLFGKGRVALLPATNEVLLVLNKRLIKIDLAVFTDPDASEVIDYDDLTVRETIGGNLQWSLLPADRYIDFEEQPQESTKPTVFVSADEKTVYVSTGARTAIIDVDALTNRRFVEPIMGFNPVSDRLFLFGPHGCSAVEASTVRDVGQCECGDTVPVPGSEETWIVTGQQNVEGQTIAFIKVVDAECNVLKDERAMDLLGISFDPSYGPASFDSTGDTFMIGPHAFARQPDDTWQEIPVQVPPGPSFQSRTSCAGRTTIDPVNRYRFDWNCDEGGAYNAGAPVALLSMDQRNIPVALQAGGGNLVLDLTHGRAIFLGKLQGITIVHYADSEAYNRQDIDLQDVDTPVERPVCSDLDPCSDPEAICVAETSTALSGLCYANRRRPELVFCGGMTGVVCDDGYTCEVSDTSNPFAVGVCTGDRCVDFATCGPACGDPPACPTGMTCQAGRCVPNQCYNDADCPAGQVCGLIYGMTNVLNDESAMDPPLPNPALGRACMDPGPLPDGAICLAAEECAHGACVFKMWIADDLWQPETVDLVGEPYLGICATPCLSTFDCDPGYECSAVLPEDRSYLPDAFMQVEPRCMLAAETACDASCVGGLHCRPTGYLQGGECSFPSYIKECVSTADCPEPFDCIEIMGPSQEVLHYCAYGCHTSADCPDGRVCGSGGMCGESCGGGTVCQPDEICVDSQCVVARACGSDEMCAANGICVGGVCVEGTLCTHGVDCAANEECFVKSATALEGRCGPDTHPYACGCIGDYQDDMVCWVHLEHWNLERWCIVPDPCSNGCEPAPPYDYCAQHDPENRADDGTCDCPGCTWDATDCGGYRPPCGSGFDCIDGEYCRCWNSTCQESE